jgi:hypothetical protein
MEEEVVDKVAKRAGMVVMTMYELVDAGLG